MSPRTACRLVTVALLLLALLVGPTACSPEATRARGGGPGADIGNHSPNTPEHSTAPPAPGG